MRVLVENSNYFLLTNNYGDQALFRATITRLLAAWPDAQLSWITRDPALMRHVSPVVRPHRLYWRHDWEMTPTEAPRLSESALRRLTGRLAAPLRFVDRPRLRGAVNAADLAFATGGGWFSDAFAGHARGVLDTLQAVQARGKPAVILGAGFERIQEPALLAKARAVLPKLDLIVCREPQTSPALLAEFGVSPDRVLVMGDPALEYVAVRRYGSPGDSIGVNLRIASYSEAGRDQVPVLRAALHETAAKLGALLRPIPISVRRPRDMDAISALINGWPTPGSATAPTDLDSLISEVGRCRVVVTGSYHAAVFALAQGIPAVTLARSLHYNTKLHGLQAQFGEAGCAVLALDSPDLASQLRDAIERAWQNATTLRPELLDATQAQIGAADRAYARLGKIVGQ